MIDTLKVHLEDIEVKDGANLIIQPSPYDVGTGELLADYPLYQDEAGKVISGAKGYINNERWNLTLRAGLREGAFVHFSIPKLINGNNFYPTSREQASEAISQVGRELWDSGVHCEINEGEMSRVDTFGNIQTEEAYSAYTPLFNLMKAKRQYKRDYGTTFSWMNTQQELTIYDKLEEMRRRGGMTEGYPDRTMRFEYRLLNKRKIQNILGFSAVKDIPERWDDIGEKYKSAWREHIFRLGVNDVELLAGEQIESELRHFKAKFGRNYFDKYLKAFGAYSLSKLVTEEGLRLALESIERDHNFEARRKKVSRALDVLQQAKREVALLRNEGKGEKTLKDLYLELQEKVLAE